ncbi:MAG: hypothetical protein ABIM99_03795 [Candidatus Dojkabacteria bacterium]
MSGNTVRNVLSIWIFVALVGLGVGLALFINKINTAPEDSKASALAGATIELGIQARPNVSEANQLLFNVGDTIGFTVSLPTFPTDGNRNTIILRVQYLKANLEAPSDLFTVDKTKYLGVPVDSPTSCVPLSAAYICRRMDISRLDGVNFTSGEVVANLKLTAKVITPAAGAKVEIFPATVAGFLPDSHSYISNKLNINDPLVFALSPKANKVIKIDDQCYGDYNRLTSTISGEIVDPSDLSVFAQKYGGKTLLQGSDQELDIDTRGVSKDYIEGNDLRIFAQNYGLATCTLNRSDTLPAQ